MAENKLVSKYQARIVTQHDDDPTEHIDGTLTYTQRKMLENNNNERMAARSTAIRMGDATLYKEALGVAHDASLLRTYADAKKTIAAMDKEDPLDQVMIEYAQQRVVTTKDDYLTMQQALTEELIERAGNDIMRGIPPEPPAPAPPPVIVQAAPEEFRPAEGVRDWGVQKFVRKAR